MENFIGGAVSIIVAVTLFCLGMIAGVSITANDCKSLHSFIYSGVVYECKVRP